MRKLTGFLILAFALVPMTANAQTAAAPGAPSHRGGGAFGVAGRW